MVEGGGGSSYSRADSLRTILFPLQTLNPWQGSVASGLYALSQDLYYLFKNNFKLSIKLIYCVIVGVGWSEDAMRSYAIICLVHSVTAVAQHQRIQQCQYREPSPKASEGFYWKGNACISSLAKNSSPLPVLHPQ